MSLQLIYLPQLLMNTFQMYLVWHSIRYLQVRLWTGVNHIILLGLTWLRKITIQHVWEWIQSIRILIISLKFHQRLSSGNVTAWIKAGNWHQIDERKSWGLPEKWFLDSFHFHFPFYYYIFRNPSQQGSTVKKYYFTACLIGIHHLAWI